ncbi:Hypothetical predicted protein [Podarcis lilfordi]|uniref:Uncharacterized protein n=1 Tax=Podarcis lilfordi TaxID=74358 RepID=A0AA35P7X4_9SAUR|nr:Hypothetical predicted protein [Podarcis lilfordi]
MATGRTQQNEQAGQSQPPTLPYYMRGMPQTTRMKAPGPQPPAGQMAPVQLLWANVIINTALSCCPDSAPLPGYDESFQFGTKEMSGCSEGSLLCYESMTWHTAKCLELISIRRDTALLTKSNVIVLEIASGEECKAHSKKSRKENNLSERNTILEKDQLPSVPQPPEKPPIKVTLLQNCAGKPSGCCLDPVKQFTD